MFSNTYHSRKTFTKNYAREPQSKPWRKNKWEKFFADQLTLSCGSRFIGRFFNYNYFNSEHIAWCFSNSRVSASRERWIWIKARRTFVSLLCISVIFNGWLLIMYISLSPFRIQKTSRPFLRRLTGALLRSRFWVVLLRLLFSESCERFMRDPILWQHLIFIWLCFLLSLAYRKCCAWRGSLEFYRKVLWDMMHRWIPSSFDKNAWILAIFSIL